MNIEKGAQFGPGWTICSSKPGWAMSLDSITLYFVATMIAALLGAMLLFFGKQQNSAALNWWGTAYLVGAAAVALWALASVTLGEMLSLALNAVGFLACGMVWNAARIFHGRKPMWAGPFARSDRVDRRRRESRPWRIGVAHDDRGRHHRDLRLADGGRIVDRAPQVVDRDAGPPSWFRSCTVWC